MSIEFMDMLSDIYHRKYKTQLQNLISKKAPCGFFCGFYQPENILRLINSLKDSGITLKYIFAHSIEYKKILGDIDIPLVLLNDLRNLKDDVQCVFYPDMSINTSFTKFFMRYGIEALPIILDDSAENTFNFYMDNLAKLYVAHEMFSDEESKKVFRAYITAKTTRRIADYRFAPEAQYFLEGFLPKEGDIAIDGGAYDGATSRDFTMQGAKVYAFEMSAKNYKNCLERAEKYNFVIENMGLSNCEAEDYYNEFGVGARRAMKGGGGNSAKFIDLDTYVLKKNLPRVDYIKLDIEGAELDMLHGAAKTISRWKPKMAISAYHKPEDLWTLINFVKSLRSDYEFKFRHYRTDCNNYILSDAEKNILHFFDLDYFLSAHWEAVLYCR